MDPHNDFDKHDRAPYDIAPATNTPYRELREQRDELLAALKDARRTLKACISACAEKRIMGIQSQPCLVCRLGAAIARAEDR